MFVKVESVLNVFVLWSSNSMRPKYVDNRKKQYYPAPTKRHQIILNPNKFIKFTLQSENAHVQYEMYGVLFQFI